MRAAGATVILVDGALAAWMGRGERQLVTFLDQAQERAPEETAAEIARTLAQQMTGGARRALFIQEVNGLPVQDSPMSRALLEAGFSPTSHGYLRRL